MRLVSDPYEDGDGFLRHDHFVEFADGTREPLPWSSLYEFSDAHLAAFIAAAVRAIGTGRQYVPGDLQPAHAVQRQQDEYACSCGRRWAVEDGADHP